MSCPEPVTLTGDGADQAVSRTATASDGETASIRVGDIDIDSTGPKVAVRGGRPAKARCVASDALSGLDSCTLTRSRKGKKVTVVARYPNTEVNASGWLRGEDLMYGRAAVVTIDMNPGRLVLFGIRPQHRAQTHATFPLLFNALYWPVQGDVTAAN